MWKWVLRAQSWPCGKPQQVSFLLRFTYKGQEVVNFWLSSHGVVTVADNNFLSALLSSPAHVSDIIFCETAVAWPFTHLFPAKANANSQGNSWDNQESWLFPSWYTLLNFFPYTTYYLSESASNSCCTSCPFTTHCKQTFIALRKSKLLLPFCWPPAHESNKHQKSGHHDTVLCANCSQWQVVKKTTKQERCIVLFF